MELKKHILWIEAMAPTGLTRFQLGARLPPATGEASEALRVIDITKLLSDDQDNVFQIISVGEEGSELERVGRAAISEVPERLVTRIEYLGEADNARKWMENEAAIEAELAEEDEEEEEGASEEVDEVVAPQPVASPPATASPTPQVPTNMQVIVPVPIVPPTNRS